MATVLYSTIGCAKQELLPSDYVVWVTDPVNGLQKEKEISPLRVEALYKPIGYIISNEKRRNEISQEEYKQRAKELEGMHYITLKLGITNAQQDVTNWGVTDQQSQEERLAYLSFEMQKDIKLVEGTDTLPCALFHFERSYDLSTQRTFVLAFEKRRIASEEDKTLILDLAYFKTGPIKLTYKNSELTNSPNLKLQ
ncbi:MAG: hypothetical protein MK212_09960 [Saprospiraceae bacterium]|nr:hypothetical protein [Saprospiraceae bacterium]